MMGFLDKLRGKGRRQQARQEQASGVSGVLFWFDWEEISGAGYSLYGSYAYERILPLFAPGVSEVSFGCYFFFDGDCLPKEPIEIPYYGLDESLCIDAVKKQGVQNCYVVAVYGTGEVSFEEVHRGLGRSDMVGYIGKTSCPGTSLEAFESLVRKMHLPFAFSLQGRLFKKSSFAFVSDDQLRTWGFEPVDDAW